MTQAPTSVFVDTNVFLRFLTADDPQMAKECLNLFERAEAGEFQLQTSHLVLGEIVWTLQSHYRMAREEIAELIADLLALRSLRVDHKEMLRGAVRAYASTNVDFIDTYNAADSRRRGTPAVCSYDRDFDKLGVTRVEPASLLAN